MVKRRRTVHSHKNGLFEHLIDASSVLKKLNLTTRNSNALFSTRAVFHLESRVTPVLNGLPDHRFLERQTSVLSTHLPWLLKDYIIM
jgi:hypothetical protein